jgi:AcrR family transcriptional regulator
MPPKQKFIREEIIAAALGLVRREGIAALTARGLGAELETSSRPVFTAFQNMDEVQRETVKAARAVYDGYIDKGLAESSAFKGVGMQYIRFAEDEPRLFALLFMRRSEARARLDNILPAIDMNSDRILASIQEPYGLSRESAMRLYKSMWLFTHGIACLCATGMMYTAEDETDRLLTEVCVGLLMKLKNEG